MYTNSLTSTLRPPSRHSHCPLQAFWLSVRGLPQCCGGKTRSRPHTSALIHPAFECLCNAVVAQMPQQATVKPLDALRMSISGSMTAGRTLSCCAWWAVFSSRSCCSSASSCNLDRGHIRRPQHAEDMLRLGCISVVGLFRGNSGDERMASMTSKEKCS